MAYSAVGPRAAHQVLFAAQVKSSRDKSLSLLLLARCRGTASSVGEVGTVWLLRMNFAHLRMYFGRQAGCPSEVHLTARVNSDLFEVNLKTSSLLLMLFPGPQESGEPGRTGMLLLRRSQEALWAFLFQEQW